MSSCLVSLQIVSTQRTRHGVLNLRIAVISCTHRVYPSSGGITKIAVGPTNETICGSLRTKLFVGQDTLFFCIIVLFPHYGILTVRLHILKICVVEQNVTVVTNTSAVSARIAGRVANNLVILISLSEGLTDKKYRNTA